MLLLRMALARQRGHEGLITRWLPRFFSRGLRRLTLPCPRNASGGQDVRACGRTPEPPPDDLNSSAPAARGFISFEDSGIVIISPVAHAPSLNRMGVATDHVINVGTFTQGQKEFLDYHRESVLLQARH
jgi:hypothetical protein